MPITGFFRVNFILECAVFKKKISAEGPSQGLVDCFRKRSYNNDFSREHSVHSFEESEQLALRKTISNSKELSAEWEKIAEQPFMKHLFRAKLSNRGESFSSISTSGLRGLLQDQSLQTVERDYKVSQLSQLEEVMPGKKLALSDLESIIENANNCDSMGAP